MTHGSLFSGIGGFDLAAEWTGINNIFQVEINTFCLKVLKKNFPDVKKYKDIYDFDGTKYKGAIDIISGGFPCQPFSVAGKRKSKRDDRYLWDEMLRIIKEIKPEWVIAENVPGIISIEGGLVFEQILFDLESINYEIQPFLIPAVSKNAPHKRNRVWFVAHNKKTKCNGSGNTRARWSGFTNENSITTNSDSPSAKHTIQAKREKSSMCIGANTNPDINNKRELQSEGVEQIIRGRISNENKIVANSDLPSSSRFKRHRGKILQKYSPKRFSSRDWEKSWVQVATELCRVDDGLPKELDKNRKQRLMGLGNAIVPQIAYEIFKAILETKLEELANKVFEGMKAGAKLSCKKGI